MLNNNILLSIGGCRLMFEEIIFLLCDSQQPFIYQVI